MTVAGARRAAAGLGCGLLVVLTAAGCASDAERAADGDAAATADNVTRFLRSEVVTPGQPAAEQLARVRRWLAAPSADYTRDYPAPDLRVLPSTGARVDVVVYEYGRTTVTEGKKGAWGLTCRRYTVDAASRLAAESIDCPADVPRTPAP